MTRVALVTGGAKRLGNVISTRLAKEGYRILIHYLNSHDEAIATRAACLAAGAPTADIIRCDLLDTEQRSSLIATAMEMAGRLDLLVNSASMFEYDEASSFTRHALTAHLQTNYLAPVEFTMDIYKAINASVPSARAISPSKRWG